MKEHLKERIIRSIDSLSDERGYQVLDYVEFLESKYGERAAPTGILAQISDTVTDTMRAGKLPLDAITGTAKIFGGASKVMTGLMNTGSLKRPLASRALSTPAKNATPVDAKPADVKPDAVKADPAKPAEPKSTERTSS